ncbi:unnamed protein product [Brugia timori]|uniref:Transposase n=1 Tax=Brugia timori TaxID=42155 RepID=A0A0R3QS22_9BILA|nr:unnamed protein product [Brugia timori]
MLHASQFIGNKAKAKVFKSDAHKYYFIDLMLIDVHSI